MNVVIAGVFPQSSRERIAACFPAGWQLRIVEPAELPRELADAEVLIPEHVPVDAALLEKAPKLRLVQTGAGYDNVDLAACTARAGQVCSAPNVNADAVAEHVMAFLLCWYKNILPLDRFLKSRAPESELFYVGAELSEKTIGIVGMGNVGKKLAACCGAFHMRVLGCSRHPFTLEGVEPRDLTDLCRESDVISLHVPLTADTRHLIGAEALGLMKPDALLINTARGAVIDEAALVEALRQRRIGGACLDVFEDEPLPVDSPLRELENVILTPHTAGLPDGVKFHKKRCAYFIRNIERILNGEPPEGRVNLL